MSLLMDALKRAESNKQEAARNLSGREAPTDQPESGISLEPLDNVKAETTPSVSPLPDLAKHLDAVDADLAASARPLRPGVAPPAVTQAPDSGERAAVRNAFAAKEASEQRKTTVFWLLGLLLLAAAAIGGYVWYQLQTIGKASAMRPSPSSTRPAALPSGQMEIQRTPGNAVPALPLPAAPAILPPVLPSTASVTPPRRNEAMETSAPSPLAIRIVRTQPEANAALVRGHGKLQNNALDEARGDYEQALRADPNNVDTLLGLAAIAQRQGRLAEAEAFRQRAYEVAPQDPAAQAAFIGSTANGDALTTESRLKNLLSAQPESPALNFSLGNLYARQNRWNEAQQAYFNALAGDADNPDYLFNLAVSLDHLRQNKLAAQHYRLALEAARKRPAAFDPERLDRRLNALQQP